MTETHRVRDLAQLVAEIDRRRDRACRRTRATRRTRTTSHVENRRLLNLGLDPITLSEGLLREVTEIARQYADRADLSKIPCRSLWRPAEAKGGTR